MAVVAAIKESEPTATLVVPVVSAVKAFQPSAVFSSPVVTASKAVVPTATFLLAVSVDAVGLLPNQIELFSTNASLNQLILVAPPALEVAQEGTPEARVNTSSSEPLARRI